MILRIYRGLPGSGKTTLARAWVAEDPTVRARVNRDSVRAMLHDSVFLGPTTERSVMAVRDAAIGSLLRRGVSIACDDTNLPSRVIRDLLALATSAGVPHEVVDLTNVSAEVCIERDAARAVTVGASVIRDMHTRYLRGQPYPLPMPMPSEAVAAVAEYGPPYLPPRGKPTAVMVDVDGTVALMNGRSPYDETRVGDDQPNLPVIAAVNAMRDTGHRVLFCSGRTEACRLDTVTWLDEHLPRVGVQSSALFMRAPGDTRKDAIVKAEIFDRHIRDHYRVVAVFDDRNSVVAMWRSLGLTVFQVADGDF